MKKPSWVSFRKTRLAEMATPMLPVTRDKAKIVATPYSVGVRLNSFAIRCGYRVPEMSWGKPHAWTGIRVYWSFALWSGFRKQFDGLSHRQTYS